MTILRSIIFHSVLFHYKRERLTFYKNVVIVLKLQTLKLL